VHNKNQKQIIMAKENLWLGRLSKEEQRAYNAHYDTVRYQRSVIQTGLMEGRMEGRIEGIKEGRAEGIVEGRAEGIVEGKREQALSIARNALKIGMEKEAIIKLTGLSTEDLADL
jgi:predicted transposase YdaD